MHTWFDAQLDQKILDGLSGGGYISHLDRVSNSIRDPEENEPLVWEYLWNDPLQHNMALPPDVEVDRTGFVHNFRCVSTYLRCMH
jgi:hypothetical protein